MDDSIPLRLLMYCLLDGRMIAVEQTHLFGTEDAIEFHAATVELYRLIDKYDCEDFKPDCRKALARCVRPCLEIWTPDEFIEEHIDPLERNSECKYPEGLYPILAEAWRVFATRHEPCAQLDAMIKSNPEISLAIAKCYRAKLIRGINGMMSMEGFEEPEVDEESKVE